MEAGGQGGDGLQEVVRQVSTGDAVQGVEAGDLTDVVVMEMKARQPRSGLELIPSDGGQPVVAQVKGLEALEAEEVRN